MVHMLLVFKLGHWSEMIHQFFLPAVVVNTMDIIHFLQLSVIFESAATVWLIFPCSVQLSLIQSVKMLKNSIQSALYQFYYIPFV